MAAKKKGATRATAESMAKRQREISVSEFFAKNRHLLGFDNPRKALLTSVKEAVDNALDACEEAGILPDISVRIEDLEPDQPANKDRRYRLTVLDNGPGIVRKQVENIFGKLLYGSKFHRLKMSRGQQGIGISAAGMYGLMTTGRPMVINTKPGKHKKAHHIELAMDTTKNKPEVSVDVETDEFPTTSSGTGTQVAIEMQARFVRGKTSVEAYLEQTAIANPHAEIVFFPPQNQRNAEVAENGAEDAEQMELGSDSEQPNDPSTDAAYAETQVLPDRIIYPRTIDELPEEPIEIKPHPYGVELGTFLTKLKQTDEKALGGFFHNEFCRITPSVAKEVYKAATTSKKTITGQTRLSGVDHAAAERIYKALQKAKLRSPPTNCLSPIGVRQMLAGMLKGVQAEFYAASTRNPAVYRGNPFQIEVAIAYGGNLGGDESARVIRFANRVPLLYQQSACCSFKSVVDTGWRSYGMSQPRGAASGRPADRHDPHGERVGAVHEREQGSDRRLRRDPQGDEARLAGLRAQARNVPAPAPAHEARRPAPRCLRALHRRDRQGVPRAQWGGHQGSLRRAVAPGQTAHRDRRCAARRGRAVHQGQRPAGQGRHRSDRRPGRRSHAPTALSQPEGR